MSWELSEQSHGADGNSGRDGCEGGLKIGGWIHSGNLRQIQDIPFCLVIFTGKVDLHDIIA